MKIYEKRAGPETRPLVFTKNKLFGGNLHIVDPVVVLEFFTLQGSDSSVDSSVGLADMVVQNGTGHFAVVDHFNTFGKGVDTEQVDVFTDFAAGSLDGSGSAEGHGVIVAEDNFHSVAIFGQSIRAEFLTLCLSPVTNLVIQAFNFETGIGQSWSSRHSTSKPASVRALTENSVRY